jgi:aconitate decarboxylase
VPTPGLRAFIEDLRARDDAALTTSWVERSYLDLLGCAIAGMRELEAEGGLPRAPSEPIAQVPVLGQVCARPALPELLFRAGNHLDYDDYDSIGVHLSGVVVPALAALALDRDLAWPMFVRAYAAGAQASRWLGATLGEPIYRAGHSQTGCMGPFAVAAACGIALGLSHAQLTRALSAALVCGMERPESSTVAAIGLACAVDATRGEAAPARDDLDVLERYVRFMTGSDVSLAATLGAEWPSFGIFYKAYPCCGSIIPPVEATLKATAQLGGEEVVAIDLEVPAIELGFCDLPDPTTVRDSRFSLQYGVAAALRYGKLGLAEFTPTALRDGEVRRLMRRLVLRAGESEKVSTMRLTTATRELQGSAADILGHADLQLSLAAIQSKFLANVTTTYDAATAAACLATATARRPLGECMTALHEILCDARADRASPGSAAPSR